MIKELASQTQSTIMERMRCYPFSLSTDGSNDIQAKQFPMVVRTINPTQRTVDSELLSIPICSESATGKNSQFSCKNVLHC